MSLLDRVRDFDGDVHRNIVSLRESDDLFDDLNEGDSSMSLIAVEAESRVKSDIPTGLVQRGFHYTVAIDHPFHEPYLLTRYGNGAFGVWYGSLDLETTIHETAFHMVKEEVGVEGNVGPIHRERAISLIRCKALLIDISAKASKFPALVSEKCGVTQQIGERLQREGHPGLLAPSARRRGGINLVAFKPEMLSDVRNLCHLNYECDPVRRTVRVERAGGDPLLELSL